MDLHPPAVSVIDPINPAIERVKQVLFRPYRMSKWFTIGFCAWLAALGGGGYSYNGSFPGTKTNYTTTTANSPDVTKFGNYLHANLSWIIPAVIVVCAILLVLWVVILWIRSHGIFMLLHCVALDRGEVVIPWKKYAGEAASLWIFRLCLGLAGLLVTLPFLGAVGWTILQLFMHKTGPDASQILALLGIMMLWMCVGVVFSVVSVFTRHFVVTIMYLRGVSCMEAWREFRAVLMANIGRFILYLLFQVAIGMAMGMIVFAFVICTLFIGALLLFIPFIGTVVMLPLTGFYRSLFALLPRAIRAGVQRVCRPPAAGSAIGVDARLDELVRLRGDSSC